jgi:hypothetical protein
MIDHNLELYQNLNGFHNKTIDIMNNNEIISRSQYW